MNKKQLIERLSRDLRVETCGEINFLSTVEMLAGEMIDDIESDLLKIADGGEYEDMRREVTNYFD
jgi:hypothetical protein